jgi:hypothetical protein
VNSSLPPSQSGEPERVWGRLIQIMSLRLNRRKGIFEFPFLLSFSLLSLGHFAAWRRVGSNLGAAGSLLWSSVARQLRESP